MSTKNRLQTRWWLRILGIALLGGIVAITGWKASEVLAQNGGGSGSEPGASEMQPNTASTQLTPPSRLGGGGPTYSWYSVSGAAFIPSESTMTYTYGLGGCVLPLATSTDPWRASVNLPDGSIIKYIGIKYSNDASTGSSTSTGYITKYANDGSFADIKPVGTRSYATTGAGTFTDYSTEITDTVDNGLYAYNFVWLGSTKQKLCALRVGYIPPSIFGVALPAITK